MKKKLRGLLYSKNMANFEAFFYAISSSKTSVNSLILNLSYHSQFFWLVCRPIFGKFSSKCHHYISTTMIGGISRVLCSRFNLHMKCFAKMTFNGFSKIWSNPLTPRAYSDKISKVGSWTKVRISAKSFLAFVLISAQNYNIACILRMDFLVQFII